MKETTVIVKKFEEVEVDPTLGKILGRHTNKYATFTEKEVSTLKTIVSNLNKTGDLIVFDLIDYEEIYVDPDFSTSEVEIIIDNNGDSDARVRIENFAEWMQENYDDLTTAFLNENWNFEFHNAFVWSDQDCIRELIDWLVDVKNFSIVRAEYIPQIKRTFLNRATAENYIVQAKHHYSDKVKIEERTIQNDGMRILNKLLSLLNL